MKALKTIPFLRILIPFVGGILLSNSIQIPLVHWLVMLALLGGITALLILPAIKNKIAFLIAVDLFLLTFGSNLVHLANASLQKSFYGNVVPKDSAIMVVAVVSDLPTTKQKFIKCPLQILEVKTPEGYKQVSGNCLAYFKRSLHDSLIKAGTSYLIKTKFAAVKPPQNPYEFDYKQYLYYKQIYHTVFVDSNSFYPLAVSQAPLNRLWQMGLDCKHYLMSHLKASALNETAYAVCCALLTGYDDEIDKSVMDSFSHSGTLHVLSVSGLHTGLIYLMMSFIFDLLDRRRKYKLTRFLIITITLWLFALVTGFAAPVLRAVIMFCLFGLGKIYFRNSATNQLNILLASAFILLCYNPFYLMDVGFLLSYFALAGLICFQPPLSALWKPQNVILNSVWQSTTASFSATISTLPFTLFYFKQFPIWFFVCNIVVIPATFVILLLALLVVVKIGFAAIVINYLVWLMTKFIDLFNSENYGFIDAIDFSFTDALFLTLLIFVFSIALYYRSPHYLRIAFVVLIFWQASALIASFNSKRKNVFTLYALKNKSAFMVKNASAVYVSPIDSADYNYHIKPQLISFNNPTIHADVKMNFLKSNDKSVLLLNKPGYLPKVNLEEVTVLILCNNIRISEKELGKFRRLKLLVVDGSDSFYEVKKIKTLCVKRKISFYDVRENGAFVVGL